MESTTHLHHKISHSILNEANDFFDHAAALDATVDVLNPYARRESRRSARAFRPAFRDRRHRCPYHCYSRAGSIGRVAVAVVSDTTISVRAQKKHLVLPGIRAQWPVMAEHHGLTASPVLVI